MTMPPTEFRSASHRDYWQNRERRRAYYAAYHKRRMAEDSVYAEKRRASARRGAKKRRDESLAIIREAKRRPCLDCGVELPPECMDLDHVRGEKVLNLSGLRTQFASYDTIRAEIAKCDVRCPNCHRLRHYKERHDA